MKLRKFFIIFIIMGIIYIALEMTVNAFTDPVGKFYISLKGCSSIWMIIIGGLCGLSLGILNEIKCIKNMKMLFQTLIGCFIITNIEFVSGVILNIYFGLNIWDYSKYPLNLLGQIELFHCIGWFFISPLVFWMDDMIRYFIYNEGRLYNALKNYKNLFTFK